MKALAAAREALASPGVYEPLGRDLSEAAATRRLPMRKAVKRKLQMSTQDLVVDARPPIRASKPLSTDHSKGSWLYRSFNILSARFRFGEDFFSSSTIR